MTIDIHLKKPDEDFIEEIDEIIEDTMIQMFFLHPQDEVSIHNAQALSLEYPSIFYSLPLSYIEMIDDNCIGIFIDDLETLQTSAKLQKPLFIPENALNDLLIAYLLEHHAKGIILDATLPHENLPDFLISLGANCIDTFDTERLAALSMDRIALHSAYPDFDFDDLTAAIKKISDAMFRPEQSIIARATKNTLEMFGFKK